MLILKHTPRAVIFNNLLPDMPRSCVRWSKNERGNAGEPNWSVHPPPGPDLRVTDEARWFPAEAEIEPPRCEGQNSRRPDAD